MYQWDSWEMPSQQSQQYSSKFLSSDGTNHWLKINKKSENVNKWEFFKKLFSIWKFNPKTTSHAPFRIFGWYLLQKLNFFGIHVIFDPKWFPGPVVWPLRSKFFNYYCDQWLVPWLDKNLEEYCWDCWDGISELSQWYTQLLLSPLN